MRLLSRGTQRICRCILRRGKEREREIEKEKEISEETEFTAAREAERTWHGLFDVVRVSRLTIWELSDRKRDRAILPLQCNARNKAGMVQRWNSPSIIAESALPALTSAVGLSDSSHRIIVPRFSHEKILHCGCR